MSIGIYPEFEKKLAGAKFDSTGEALAAEFETLDKIAKSAKLTLFSAFADNRPIPEDFDGDPDDLAELMGEWNEWFDSAVGSAAMLALAETIKTNPKAAKRLDSPDDVSEELQLLSIVLAAAAKKGIRFRLSMS